MNEGRPTDGYRRDERTCAEVERLLTLYAWDELEASERARVEAHARQCASCGESLSRELALRQAIAASLQAEEELDPSFLARCRSELEELLDDADQTRRGWLGLPHPRSWFFPAVARHPAWSAVLLVVLGFVGGLVVPEWYRARVAQLPAKPALTVSASPPLSDQDLQNMDIAGINWVPDTGAGTPSVELHLKAEKPLLVQGTLDDTDVKRVLTYVVENGQRFDPGVRLDSVDVLRMRPNDRGVRQALCVAARKDRNPGVRLRALEALRGFEQDGTVRQILLDALLYDANPGVRVEAINSLEAALRTMAETGSLAANQRAVDVLRDRMQKDPNNYVRMQCAAAIRQLGPRQPY